MKHRYTSHHEVGYPMPDWAADLSDNQQWELKIAATSIDPIPFDYWVEDFQDQIDAGFSEESALKEVSKYIPAMMEAYEVVRTMRSDNA